MPVVSSLVVIMLFVWYSQKVMFAYFPFLSNDNSLSGTCASLLLIGLTLLAYNIPQYFQRACWFGSACYDKITPIESTTTPSLPRNLEYGAAMRRDIDQLKVSFDAIEDVVIALGNNVTRTMKNHSAEVSDIKQYLMDGFNSFQTHDVANENAIKQLAERVNRVETRVQTETHSANTGDVKVLLFTYMRSGSTFFGDFFNKNPNVAYWFEPLNGFYKDFYLAGEGTFPLDIVYHTNGTKRYAPLILMPLLMRLLRQLLPPTNFPRFMN